MSSSHRIVWRSARIQPPLDVVGDDSLVIVPNLFLRQHKPATGKKSPRAIWTEDPNK